MGPVDMNFIKTLIRERNFYEKQYRNIFECATALYEELEQEKKSKS